jgi:hypothetical protein
MKQITVKSTRGPCHPHVVVTSPSRKPPFILQAKHSNSDYGYKESGLGALGDLYRYISESLRSLELMQKDKDMEMGSSRFFID